MTEDSHHQQLLSFSYDGDLGTEISTTLHNNTQYISSTNWAADTPKSTSLVIIFYGTKSHETLSERGRERWRWKSVKWIDKSCVKRSEKKCEWWMIEVEVKDSKKCWWWLLKLLQMMIKTPTSPERVDCLKRDMEATTLIGSYAFFYLLITFMLTRITTHSPLYKCPSTASRHLIYFKTAWPPLVHVCH